MKKTLVSVIRIVFIFFFALIFGCTKHHQIFLNPSLPIHDSKFGNKISVSLYVEDSRKNNIIAKWEKGLRKFSISSQHDLRKMFLAKIQQGLIKLDFNPKVHRRNPNHYLKVNILDIRSKYSEQMLGMDVRIKARLHANCKNNHKTYSKIYSAQKNRRGITLATFPNENLLNAVLSKIMGQMFSDQALLSCLKNRTP